MQNNPSTTSAGSGRENLGRTPRENIPPAWYDISCRVSSVKAVASYIAEAIPIIRGDEAC